MNPGKLIPSGAPLVLSLLVAGCGSDDAGSRPADMSAGGGRDQAAQPDLSGAHPDLSGSGNPDLIGGLVHVSQHHNNPSRDGVFIEPAFKGNAPRALTRDASFDGTITGHVYAQPLYVEGGPAGRAVVITVTEGNDVYALDARDGTVAWQRNVAPAVPLSRLPCGNIDPLGITGTPVVDVGRRRLFLDAMTTPDGGATKQHKVFALDVDTGADAAGWPAVDVGAVAAFNQLTFDSQVQNERGALALVGGTVYVPFGGHYGDCGNYHGWLLGVSADNPAAPLSWATRARAGGAWAVGGVSSDGESLFIATGNTFGANTWQDGEAIFKFAAGPVLPAGAGNYWAPANWKALDNGDVDLGGSGALIVDVPGATPSALVVALGKDGYAYLLDRGNLGGIGAEVARKQVSTGEIIQAAATYRTTTASYVVFRGAGLGCNNGPGDLTAFTISAESPPRIQVAWCASENGQGSPWVTTSDGQRDVVVWGLGAEGDQRLHGFNGDTGDIVYAGGGNSEKMAGIRRFNAGIAARGRMFVAADNRVYAFKP